MMKITNKIQSYHRGSLTFDPSASEKAFGGVVLKLMNQQDFQIMFSELMEVAAELSQKNRVPLETVTFMDVVTEIRRVKLESKNKDKLKDFE